MLTTTIKYLFIYYFCIIICMKSFSRFKPSPFHTISISLMLSFMTCILSTCLAQLKYHIPLIMLVLILGHFTFQPIKTFITTTLSFTISYSIYALSSFLIASVFVTIWGKQISYPLLALTSGIIQFPLILYLLSLKRFKHAFSFLGNRTIINVGLCLCVLLWGFSSYITTDYTLLRSRLSGLISFLITLAFLIYWWQAQITKAYRRRLELRELESLRTEVTELNLAVARLTEENEKLARITHRDNTLITTLKNSTIKYLSTDFKNPAEAFATRDKLISNINALSTERMALSANSCETQARCFDTGLPLLDELLGHMDEKATQNNISFSVHFATVLTDFVPKDISENDLVHTIDDLLKNAFNATTTCEKRSVQLQFYKLGKHFVVEVADNGIPFEIKSLVNMGLEKITTYADGSGIGLVDIWTTKEKYGATYHLDEYTSQPSFTKKISLTFDKKNLYSIRTWRKDEILQISKRTDLQVYDYSD